MPECPACHIDSEFIYIGPIHVECINPFCRHYDNDTRQEYDKARDTHPNDTLEYDFSDLDEEEETKDEDIYQQWLFPRGITKD